MDIRNKLLLSSVILAGTRKENSTTGNEGPGYKVRKVYMPAGRLKHFVQRTEEKKKKKTNISKESQEVIEVRPRGQHRRALCRGGSQLKERKSVEDKPKRFGSF